MLDNLYFHICYSKESCKKAHIEAQGLVLFGNKIKLSPVDREGKVHWIL